MNGIEADQGVSFAKGMGLTPRYLILFDKDEPRSKLLETVRARAICKPLLIDGKPL